MPGQRDTRGPYLSAAGQAAVSALPACTPAAPLRRRLVSRVSSRKKRDLDLSTELGPFCFHQKLPAQEGQRDHATWARPCCLATSAYPTRDPFSPPLSPIPSPPLQTGAGLIHTPPLHPPSTYVLLLYSTYTYTLVLRVLLIIITTTTTTITVQCRILPVSCRPLGCTQRLPRPRPHISSSESPQPCRRVHSCCVSGREHCITLVKAAIRAG